MPREGCYMYRNPKEEMSIQLIQEDQKDCDCSLTHCTHVLIWVAKFWARWSLWTCYSQYTRVVLIWLILKMVNLPRAKKKSSLFFFLLSRPSLFLIILISITNYLLRLFPFRIFSLLLSSLLFSSLLSSHIALLSCILHFLSFICYSVFHVICF